MERSFECGMRNEKTKSTNGAQSFQSGFVQDPIGSHQSMTLSRAGSTIAQFLAAKSRHPATRFLDENVTGANVPVGKRRIRVHLPIDLPARHHPDLPPARQPPPHA